MGFIRCRVVHLPGREVSHHHPLQSHIKTAAGGTEPTVTQVPSFRTMIFLSFLICPLRYVLSLFSHYQAVVTEVLAVTIRADHRNGVVTSGAEDRAVVTSGDEDRAIVTRGDEHRAGQEVIPSGAVKDVFTTMTEDRA